MMLFWLCVVNSVVLDDSFAVVWWCILCATGSDLVAYVVDRLL